MTNEKILEVLDFYDNYIRRKLITEKECFFSQNLALYNHILQMIPKMKQFISEGRWEKLMRWLGFIQGVLCTKGYTTIDEERVRNTKFEESPRGFISVPTGDQIKLTPEEQAKLEALCRWREDSLKSSLLHREI